MGDRSHTPSHQLIRSWPCLTMVLGIPSAAALPLSQFLDSVCSCYWAFTMRSMWITRLRVAPHPRFHAIAPLGVRGLRPSALDSRGVECGGRSPKTGSRHS
jgi:hypothetical protein